MNSSKNVASHCHRALALFVLNMSSGGVDTYGQIEPLQHNHWLHRAR